MYWSHKKTSMKSQTKKFIDVGSAWHIQWSRNLTKLSRDYIECLFKIEYINSKIGDRSQHGNHLAMAIIKAVFQRKLIVTRSQKHIFHARRCANTMALCCRNGDTIYRVRKECWRWLKMDGRNNLKQNGILFSFVVLCHGQSSELECKSTPHRFFNKTSGSQNVKYVENSFVVANCQTLSNI
jgi:hypothetical protein